MKHNAFAGTGKVFRFTLEQLLKSKANIRSLIIMLVIALISVPMLSLINGDAVKAPDEGTAEIYLDNQSHFSLSGLSDYLEDAGAGKFSVIEDDGQEPDSDLLAFRIVTEANGKLRVEDLSGDLAASGTIAQLISGYLSGLVLEEAGFSQKEIAALTGAQEASAFTESYSDQEGPALSPAERNDEIVPDEEAEEDRFDQGGYATQLGYSILLMMICILSISFVIRSVVEEKTSKLVDLLMVSIKPGALLLGKVLAALVYTLLYYVVLIGGVLLSRSLFSLFTDTSAAEDFIHSFLQIDLRPDVIVILVITSLLGFLAFGILSGLCGAGCSSLEESSGAMSLCMMLIMLGYMVSIVSNAIGQSSGGSQAVFCILPVISMFTAPTLYMFGQVGILPVLVGWAVQLVFIVLLLLLAAKVYASLIIYKGKRLGFLQILRLSRGKEAVK